MKPLKKNKKQPVQQAALFDAKESIDRRTLQLTGNRMYQKEVKKTVSQ